MNDFGQPEIYDRRFWAKNNGAIVTWRHNGAFLDHFLNILGQFLQKTSRFLQKMERMERFLTLLKKTGSFSRSSVRCSNLHRNIRTYGKNTDRKIKTVSLIISRRDAEIAEKQRELYPQISQSIIVNFRTFWIIIMLL